MKEWLAEYKSEVSNLDTSVKEKLDHERFISYLKKNLPIDFTNWKSPEQTGVDLLDPISVIAYEFDSEGYLYASLYNKKRKCLISQCHAPDLYELEMDELATDHPNLLAMFIASCFLEVLPIVCQQNEFLNLPREKEILFKVGAHGGWEDESLYIYKDDNK